MPNDPYHETVDAVIDGVMAPPPGFERFKPSAADLEEMNAAFKRIDAENEYDERSDG